MEISVPEFRTLDEFVNWCQDPFVQEFLKKNPQVISGLITHPNVERWLDEFLDVVQKTTNSDVRSHRDTIRLLTMSNPEDRKFVQEIVERYRSQKTTVQRDAGEEAKPQEELSLFGRYRIHRKVAEGGFGAVYLAYDPQLDRMVALKLLKLRTAGEIEHFEKEAKLAAKLRHPNIIPVHELGVLDNQPYFTMDYIEGKTLRDLLDASSNKRLSVENSFRIISFVADALNYAHTNGIIHRDIKPENIFLDRENRVYVGDFGIAKRVEDKQCASVKSSRIVGTPQYMSPEQANGETIDARSDIWSLGVVLYEMVCGVCPFEDDVVIEVFKKIWFSEPVAPRKMNPRIDKDAETIVMKCLEKEPNNRYASALELKEDIERYLRGEPIKARPVSTVEKLWRRVKRNKAASLGISVAVVALIVVGFILLGHSEIKQREAVRRKAEEILKRVAIAATLDEKMRLSEEAILLDKTYFVPYIEKGKILKEANREEEALAVFEQAHKVARQNKDSEGEAVASFYIGMIYWRRQDYTRGLNYFKRVLELMPNVRNPMTLYVRASEAYHQGEYEKSIEFIEEVLKLKPDFPEAYNTRGAARMQMRDFEGALADYNKAIELDHKFVAAYNNRGTVRYRKGDYDGAMADWSKSIELNPKFAVAWNNRGAARAEKGDYEGAIADYKKAIEADNQFFFGYYNLACVYANLKDKEKALEALKKALELDKSGLLKEKAKTDVDFEPIRESPEFKSLVEQ